MITNHQVTFPVVGNEGGIYGIVLGEVLLEIVVCNRIDETLWRARRDDKGPNWTDQLSAEEVAHFLAPHYSIGDQVTLAMTILCEANGHIRSAEMALDNEWPLSVAGWEDVTPDPEPVEFTPMPADARSEHDPTL